jgi:hypothetical protein
MFENPLHRLTVVGAVGSHGRPRRRLACAALPIRPTALRLSVRGTRSTLVLPLSITIRLPVTPGLPRLA